MGNAGEEPEESPGDTQTDYTVRRGDVIGTIAARHQVSEKDIRRWNRLPGTTIRTGQRLVIRQSPSGGTRPDGETAGFQQERKGPSSLSPKGKVYLVQKGDTLWDISRMHGGIPVRMLRKWNKLPSSKLKPGQKLIVG
jgi:membrane-bound lytic murein transglycosylase D